MTVVGYPLGGETISVSKGVVSRIEVWSLYEALILDITLLAIKLSCHWLWIFRLWLTSWWKLQVYFVKWSPLFFGRLILDLIEKYHFADRPDFSAEIYIFWQKRKDVLSISWCGIISRQLYKYRIENLKRKKSNIIFRVEKQPSIVGVSEMNFSYRIMIICLSNLVDTCHILSGHIICTWIFWVTWYSNWCRNKSW